jgi:hypothetical protein
MGVLQKVRTFVGGKRFFVCIVVLVLVQGLWFMASIKPKMFDEPRHTMFITKYTERLNPFISQQSPDWDSLGEVTRDPNYLFYYLMSFPARLVAIFTDSFIVRVTVLRAIVLGIFIVGLVLWRRLFRALGLSDSVSNVTLLFLVLTPTIAPLPAAVNYDGVVFAVTALFLLWSVRILKSKKPDALQLARLVAVGLIACLIKFTFIAVILPVFLLLGFYLAKNHGKNLLPDVWKSFLGLDLPLRMGVTLGLLIAVGLFIERPVMNIVKHRNIAPACQDFISEERCTIDPVAERNQKLLKEKPAGFMPLSPPDYALLLWIPSMITTQTRVASETSPTLPMQFLFYLFAIGGVVLVVYYLGGLKKKDRALIVLVIVTLIYSAVLFMENYQAYITYAAPLAMNGRYLLPVMPIFLALVAQAVKGLAGVRYRTLLTSGLIVLLITFSQGGGIVMSVLTADDTYYWENAAVSRVNKQAKRVVSAFVFEKTPFKKF